MKIMFICDTMGSGGAERVIATLSNSFVERGNNVSILMLSKEAKGSFYNLNAGVKLLNLDFQSGGFFKKVHAIKNFVASEGPDIVISFLSYVCIYTWLALRRTKIPYIVSERNDPHQRGRLKQYLLNKSFKRAVGCVFQTEDSAEWYKRIAKNKSIVIYNPVYLDALPDGTKATKNQILYVGRFNEQKNLFMLIDAFKLFKKGNPQYTLEMYGDGQLKQAVINYVNEQDLLNDVVISASSNKWQEEENDSKLFVLPSKYEGMPNVLAEALCLGIPSVSTNCPIGGPKELKKLFPEALVLSERITAESFAKAMEEGIKAKRVCAKIPDELKIDNIASQWLDFINHAIRKEIKNVR